MDVIGHIEDGTVVLDRPVNLPNGTRVRIEVLFDGIDSGPSNGSSSLSTDLLDLAGRAEGLPPDAAESHDDYLTP